MNASKRFCAGRPAGISRAFSLVEIVLALGVISFALVGIIGLFPAAMKSAQESQRETRATLIARQIFSDLRIQPGTNRLLVCGNSAANTNSLRTNFNLAAHGHAEFLSYDQEGSGLASTSGAVFTNGCPATVFLVRIEEDPNLPASTEKTTNFLARIEVDTNTGIPNLSRVQATIETPAVAPSANRSKYTFVTLIGY
ncbi:MAG: hypothetical protein WCS31_07380 [Verrucomicrobiae bacterium]